MVFRLRAIEVTGVNRKLSEVAISILNDEEQALLQRGRPVGCRQVWFQGLNREVTSKFLITEATDLRELCDVEIVGNVK